MIREYREQLYAYNFDNLDEMEKFIERHKLLKLIQEEKYNPKSSALYLLNKLNLWFRALPQRKLKAQMVSLLNSIKYIMKKLNQSYTNSFRTSKRRAYFSTHYMFLVLLWYQNQAMTLQEKQKQINKKPTDPYSP